MTPLRTELPPAQFSASLKQSGVGVEKLTVRPKTAKSWGMENVWANREDRL
jgi:hypothetical protein